MSTNEVRLRLLLENRSEHLCTLRLPVSMRDARTFLKLLQLDLGSHPPSAPIVAVRLAAEPAEPRVAQEGMFTPLSPEPEKLELTLARIGALVGEQNVGSPELLDTHRPGALRLLRFAAAPRLPVSPSPRHRPALSFRLFRPPHHARVQVYNGQPIFVLAEGIRGTSSHVTGPW